MDDAVTVSRRPSSPRRRLAFFALALAALLFFLLQNAFYWTGGGETWLSFKVFFLPALLVTHLALRKLPPGRLARRDRALAVPVFAFFAALAGTGPILLVNAWTGPGQVEVLAGTVVEKSRGSGRSRASVVFVDDAGVRRRWPVPRTGIDAIGVGDRFLVRAVRGGLGILYVLPEVRYWQAEPKA